MANDSSTGGYLIPAVAPAPLEDDALDDFFHDVLAGISGLDGSLVRPLWQEEPPNIPDRSVTWLAFGVSESRSDTYGVEEHDPAGDGVDVTRRHEVLTWRVSVYGPGAGAMASLIRDGFGVAQNREPLTLAGMGFVAVEGPMKTAELIKQKWLQRQDLRVIIRREIVRQYPVRNLLSAEGVILTSELPPIPIATPNKGGGVNPPYPAPSGYRWVFVVENGNRVIEGGNRVITLARAA